MTRKRSAATRRKIKLSNIRTKARKDGIEVDGVSDERLEAVVTTRRAELGPVSKPKLRGQKRSPEAKARIFLAQTRRFAKESGIRVEGIPDSQLKEHVTRERKRMKAEGSYTKPKVGGKLTMTPALRAGMSERMKKRWQDPAYRDRMIATKRAYSHSPEARAKIGEANKKRKGVFKHSEAMKRKISANSVWRAKRGDFSYLGWVETVKGVPKAGRTKIGFRSLWEKRAMTLLDEDSFVASFQYEPLGVPYEWDGNPRFTLPDFLATMTDGSVVMIEVKPRGYTYAPKEQAKADACLAFCEQRGWKYEVWDERRLWPGLSQSEVRAAVALLT